jgi:transmembrane sensor
MNQNRINYLLKQYAAGVLTAEEQQELDQLCTGTNREELLQHIASLAQQNNHPPASITEETSTATFQKIIAADKSRTPHIDVARRRTRYRWMSAAAVLLLSFSAFLYFFTSPRKNPVAKDQATPLKPEKQAGRNTAILYLADNSIVELDSMSNGLVTTQGGSRVMLANGQLAYVPAAKENSTTISYNRITTPRGGEYTITLPDGTQVWLNAASSLKFPTAFTGEKREVELSGEAYFAVAEDKAHPFEVKIGNMNVAVHGTQFNVMGYEDEHKIVTTLVSGSVAVTSANDTALLVPGEHAVLNNKDGKLYTGQADVEEETAWKNGRTYFNGASITQIMRQVSRWYDVDVEYKGDVVNMDFTCTVSRKDKLSKLLNLLELTGAVHFTMKGNTIIVQQ